MQEEVTQKVIALSIKAAKLDAAVLQKALKIALEQIKKQHGKPKRGKQTMRQLTKSGEQVTNIKITDQNIKAFDPTRLFQPLSFHAVPVILPFHLSSFPRPQRPQSCPLQRRLIAPRFGK